MHFSSNNSISSNEIINNGGDGIILMQNCSYNVISKNVISNNQGDGVDIEAIKPTVGPIEECSGNILIENKITRNSDGIRLIRTRATAIYNNSLTSNYFGIVDSEGSHNLIVKNSVMNNTLGIYLASNDSDIYHNNFVDNKYQALASALAFRNTWDDGYPSGGNYWSDYNGTDLYSGPYQNLTGNDGIGDAHYIIDANNADNYPLMTPMTPIPRVPWDITGPTMWIPDGKCDIRDVAPVALYFGSEVGDGRYDARADMTGPAYLVRDGKIDIRDIALAALHFGETYH